MEPCAVATNARKGRPVAFFLQRPASIFRVQLFLYLKAARGTARTEKTIGPFVLAPGVGRAFQLWRIKNIHSHSQKKSLHFVIFALLFSRIFHLLYRFALFVDRNVSDPARPTQELCVRGNRAPLPMVVIPTRLLNAKRCI